MLDVGELRPGLWRWSAPHPDWTAAKAGAGGWDQLVGSVYYEAQDSLVLIDPLAPPARTPARERLFAALDHDVTRHGSRVAVLIANRFHARSADEIARRYSAEVWAHDAARPHLGCRVTHAFAEGDVLPGNVRAEGVEGLEPGEVVFYLPSHRALVVADAIVGAGEGELRVCPASWADPSEQGQASYLSRFRPSLRRLLDLPFEAVLVSHGAPVLTGARRALETALDSPPWSE